VVFVERFTGITKTGKRFEKLLSICVAVHFPKDARTLRGAVKLIVNSYAIRYINCRYFRTWAPGEADPSTTRPALEFASRGKSRPLRSR
jgi:hypothetical protein